MLHDGYLVRPVHQILLRRPSLLKNDPFPLSFSLSFSPYYHPLLTRSSPSSPSIVASCHPGCVVHPTILKSKRIYYSNIPHKSYASLPHVVSTEPRKGTTTRGLWCRIITLPLIAILYDPFCHQHHLLGIDQNAFGTVCCLSGGLFWWSITRNRFQPCQTTSLAIGCPITLPQHLAGRFVRGLPRRTLANILGVRHLTLSETTESCSSY